jgi:UDP-N-acetylglucosamine 2-epimerase (non-hydrolysing)
MQQKILIIIGTRPNFIKVTCFKKVASQLKNIDIKIAHTGQHYDTNMADVFFEQFHLVPDYFLRVAAGSPNFQIADIMLKLEELITNTFRPDLLIVVGDVNSTLAGALTANKMGIKLAHLEAGLRSFDRTMPEEFNRVLTDDVCDLFFVTEPSGKKHLLSEGKPEASIHYVGNTMIDTMVAFEAEIEASTILTTLKIHHHPFVLMTMHRPATVDNKLELEKLVKLIGNISKKYKVVFPIHPRTIKNAKEFGLYEELMNNTELICTEPLDYFAFQKLIKECSFIITDSGGIQEESTYRLKPCLTLRPNTERPVTITEGTNTLLSFDLETVQRYVTQIENGTYKKGSIPYLWDGKATERIMNIISGL